MDHRKYIVSELQSFSPLMAEIVPVNPYQVPDGYFNDLAINMLRLVQAEEPSSILPEPGKMNPYSVPDNYFNSFPDNVLSVVKREGPSEVLISASSTPYEVPHNYFENLAANILTRIKQQELSAQDEIQQLSPLLSKLDKKVPFTTPDGYFEEFSENIVAGTNALDFVADELEPLSPFMRNLRVENVYSTPAGYFEQLPEVILNTVRKRQPGKVVAMSFSKKVMKYAVAAVVAGIIVMAGILFVNRDSSVAPDTLAQGEEKLQEEALTNVRTLSDDELMNFIENQTASLPDYLGVNTADIDTEDVKLMLADISDSELKQYLMEYEGEAEVLTN